MIVSFFCFFFLCRLQVLSASKDGVSRSSRRWYTGIGGSVQRLVQKSKRLLACRSFVRPRALGQGRCLDTDGSSRSMVGSSLQRSCRLTPLTVHHECFCDIEWRRSCRRFHKGKEILWWVVHTDRSFFEDAAWTTVEYHGDHDGYKTRQNPWDFQTCFLHALRVFDVKMRQKTWLIFP